MNLKALSKVRETSYKRLYIVLFHLYEMSRRDKSVNAEIN